MAEVIDGKKVAADVVAKVKVLTADLAAKGGKPGLAVVIVGEDPASQVYVASKSRTAKECGFHSIQHTLPASTGQAELLKLVGALNADGVTVVLTTHYLEEAEQLCDRIAIINHGKLIANKPTRELVGAMAEKVVEITVERDVTAAPASDVFLKSELKGERTIAITYDKAQVTAGRVLEMVQQQGFTIVDVSTHEADLEDVFVQLTSEREPAPLQDRL